MFQNEYEPDNAMQKIWESTQGGYCLCTMREFCSNCANPSERRKQGNLIIEIARNMGYQLYTKAWMKSEYFKVNMGVAEMGDECRDYHKHIVPLALKEAV